MQSSQAGSIDAFDRWLRRDVRAGCAAAKVQARAARMKANALAHDARLLDMIQCRSVRQARITGELQIKTKARVVAARTILRMLTEHFDNRDLAIRFCRHFAGVRIMLPEMQQVESYLTGRQIAAARRGCFTIQARQRLAGLTDLPVKTLWREARHECVSG